MANNRISPKSVLPQRTTGAQAGSRIYLDNNATTVLDPRVLEIMMPFLTGAFGNAASRTHSFGRDAQVAVEAARGKVANLIGATPHEIIWTSGATESNNLAIKGVAWANKDRGRHIITQATEHHAVLDPCIWLERHEGFEISVLPVDHSGTVDPEQVRAAIRSDTVLVSIMWANNESGTIQPVKEIGSLCQDRGIAFHTDATQAVGKVPIDVKASGVDLLSLSAHKFHGPKGTGALYVRQRSPRLKLVPLFHGGGHERTFRSGTINVPGVVGTGEACSLCAREMNADSKKLSSLRDKFETELTNVLTAVRVNGNVKSRLPHTSHLTFDGIESEGLLVAMNDVALSTGSACTSASVEPSHVLKAMGFSETEIYASVRISLGRFTTTEEIQSVAKRFCEAVGRLRELRQLA